MRAGPEEETNWEPKMSDSLVLANRESIIQQVAEGKRLTEIASALGLTHSAISKQLASDPEYQEAKILHHATRLDKSEGLLEDAQDQFTLARAREIHKAYSWRASVECSRIWGNQSSIATSFGQAGITINIGTVDSGVVIDGQSLKSEEST